MLAMDEEMQAQQAAEQQAQQQQEATPADAAEGATPEAAAAASPRPLARSELECGSGGLPPGIGGSGRMASSASQEPESPLAAAAAAAAGGADAPSVYISAAPSMQLEAADVAADVAATVLLETLPDGTVQLSILLPAAAEQEGGVEGDGDESEGELPPELAGGWRPGGRAVSGVPPAVGLPELRQRCKSKPCVASHPCKWSASVHTSPAADLSACMAVLSSACTAPVPARHLHLTCCHRWRQGGCVTATAAHPLPAIQSPCMLPPSLQLQVTRWPWCGIWCAKPAASWLGKRRSRWAAACGRVGMCNLCAVGSPGRGVVGGEGQDRGG